MDLKNTTKNPHYSFQKLAREYKGFYCSIEENMHAEEWVGTLIEHPEKVIKAIVSVDSNNFNRTTAKFLNEHQEIKLLESSADQGVKYYLFENDEQDWVLLMHCDASQGIVQLNSENPWAYKIYKRVKRFILDQWRQAENRQLRMWDEQTTGTMKNISLASN